MIKKLYSAIRATLLLKKAFDCSQAGDHEGALIYLDKRREFSRETFRAAILRGESYYSMAAYDKSRNVMLKALEKVENAKRLNVDEKNYISAYIKDVINLSFVREGERGKVIPVVLDFDVNRIHRDFLRRYHVVVDRPGG